MNPAAIAFTPVTSAPGAPLLRGRRRPSSTKSAPSSKSRSPETKTKDRSQSNRPLALDPEKYDLMFPELSVTADPSRRSSAPLTKIYQDEKLTTSDDTVENGDDTNHWKRNGIISTTNQKFSVTMAYEIRKISERIAAQLEAETKSTEALPLSPTVYHPLSHQRRRPIATRYSPLPCPVMAGAIIKPRQAEHGFLPTPPTKPEVPLEPDFDLYPDLADPGNILGYPPPVLPHPTPDLMVTPPEGPSAAFYYPPPPYPIYPSYYDYNMRTYMCYPPLLEPPSMWSWPQTPPGFPFMPPHAPFYLPPFPPGNFPTPESTPNTTPMMKMPAPAYGLPLRQPPPHRPLSSVGVKRRCAKTRPLGRARSLSPRNGTLGSLTPLNTNAGEKQGSNDELMASPKPRVPCDLGWSYCSYSPGLAPPGHAQDFSRSNIAAPQGYEQVMNIYPEANFDDQSFRSSYLESTETSEKYQPLSPTPNGPPANAPTAPASHRRSANTQTPQAQPKSPINNRSEPGKWSQSKRWMSQETKERLAFQKILLSLHYMGADESPFVPQNPAELTALKADAAEVEKRKLANQVDRLLSKSQSKKVDDKENGSTLSTVKLFSGKQLQDQLSPVLALENYFNRTISVGDREHIEWPSLAELKEEGDKRGGRYKRCLPLPRLNRVAPRIIGRDRENSYRSDGTIRWEMKEAEQDSHFLLSAPAEVEPFFVQKSDVQKSRLPFLVRLLLDEINSDDSEGTTSATGRRT